MSLLYTNKMLEIDLSNRSITTRPTSDYSERFIGGRGINAAILHETVGPETNALHPENVLMFGIGPLVGTGAPSCPRTEVGAKSPVTGWVGQSNFGGYWGPQVKWAGYDHIIIKGKADKPVFISINDEGAQILDATDLWGHTTIDTQEMVKKKLNNPKAEVVAIGPAGENQVVFASLVHRLGNGAGRTGMGAVMGSKNLKAIAVQSNNNEKSLKFADPKQYAEICKELLDALQAEWFTKEYKEMGFTRWNDWFGRSDFLATDNYRHFNWNTWDPNEDASVQKFWEKDGIKKYGCYGCPGPCMEQYHIEGLGDTVINCQFYNLVWAAKMTDMKSFIEICALCQYNGVDITSFINLAGWMMELYEAGILKDDDLEGVPMHWGDGKSVKQFMEMLMHRRGIGDIVAGGAKEIMKQMGSDAEERLMHINGLPEYMNSHSAYKFLGLAGAISTRSDIIRALPMPDINYYCIKGYVDTNVDKELVEPYLDYYVSLPQDLTGIKDDTLYQAQRYAGRGSMCAYYEDTIALNDITGSCKFMGWWFDMPISPDFMARFYSAGTGKETSSDDLYHIARRVINLERAFNIREGRIRALDTLPKRAFTHKVPDGKFKGEVMDPEKFEKMKDEFYTTRGWDLKTGFPTRQTLVDFDLPEAVKDLEKRSLLPA